MVVHQLSTTVVADSIVDDARDVLRDVATVIRKHDLMRTKNPDPVSKWEHTLRAGEFRRIFRNTWRAYRMAMHVKFQRSNHARSS